ncbi:hypothetical protein LTR17_016004 [Elasticomyces elasticus]|nr:hypothetical protein LTR17_016004 [Elasticomyces elasticus]
MANEERPAKRTKLDFNDHIRVLVGPSKKEFVVHKDIITRRSPFFKAATSARWNGTRPIELPDDKPKVFAEYLHCLYVGELQLDQNVDPENPKLTLHLACDVFVVADKLGDLTSMNLIIDAIVAWSDMVSYVPRVSDACYAYGVTTHGSQLRRLFVEYYMREAMISHVDTTTETGITEFYGDVIKEFMESKTGPGKMAQKVCDAYKSLVSFCPKCQFHQHNDACPPCALGDSSGSKQD